MAVQALEPAERTADRPRALTPARIGLALAAACGVALAIGVVAWFGAAQVLKAFEAIGWVGFALYALYSLACYPLTGAAWWVLSGEEARKLPSFTFGRLLRESASDILPFSSVGGVVVGVRGVMLNRVPAAPAYGSMAVDLVTEIVAQIGFLGLGLALLSARLGEGGEARVFRLCFMVAIGVGLLMIAGLVLAEGRGFNLIGALAERVAPNAAAHIQGVREKVADIRADPLRLAASVAFHAAGWIASAVGSWVALRLMGVQIGVPAVIGIESLLSAAKSAAFVVPNAFGVQEAAYALIGQVFGLSGEMGVALSLLRRAKDLVLGAPALLAWQAMEGRRLFRPRRRPKVPRHPLTES